MRTLIVGGGVIGLSIGWQLARHQEKVEIFERGLIGKEASIAAAGMLAPFSEMDQGLDSMLFLKRASLSLYPQFLRELNEDAKENLPLEKYGTLFAGVDRDDRFFLERLFKSLKQRDIRVEWLSGKKAKEMEPLLSPRVFAGVWIPEETHIQNRKLLELLKRAFQNRGGIIHEHSFVEGLWVEKGCLKGLCVGKKVFGESVINAAGAWADMLYKGFSPKVYPNKGQILTLLMSDEVSLNYMIRTPRVYLVPKSNGILRVGATDELTGFDQTVTAGAVCELLQAASEVVPAISGMQVLEMDAKLRPASFDSLPCIEETELKGYFRAVGHGRSGILLAPYTSYEMVRKLCKSK